MDRKYWIYLKTMFRQNQLLIGAWLGSAFLMAALLWIYQMPVEPAFLYLLITLCVLIIWCGFYLARLHRINHLLRAEDYDPSLYPPELDACVAKLNEQRETMQKHSTQEKKLRTEMQDYFSLWAHQIKLPLASMRLQLELPELNAENLQRECQRIDSCVGLAMAYIRMEGSDFQISWYTLESIIRPILRDNSTQFIRRHIQLQTSFGQDKVCTDQKWASFIIEQLLSNALKYAPDYSTIQIIARGDTFILRDEGPGISPSDLPRVFEKGFTGENGRRQMHASSGLGLFLVKGVCDELSIGISLSNRTCPLENPEKPEPEDDETLISSSSESTSSVEESDSTATSESGKHSNSSSSASSTENDSEYCGLDVRLTFPTSSWISD